MSTNEIEKEFRIIKVLGKGSFGKVYLVEKNNSKELYALKIIDKTRVYSDDKEVEILLSIQNVPNYGKYFPRIYKKYDYRKHVGILMEYIEGTNVFKLFENKVKLSEQDLLKFMKHILEGLALLHSYGIAHRDIKDENIIFNTSLVTKSFIKIIDFGFACYFDKSKRDGCYGVRGTTLFMAPEVYYENVIKDPKLYQYSDIWSAGVVFWELISLEDPPIVDFYEDDLKGQKLYEKILKEIKALKTSKKIKCIILSCLEPNPEKRATAKELLQLL